MLLPFRYVFALAKRTYDLTVRHIRIKLLDAADDLPGRLLRVLFVFAFHVLLTEDMLRQAVDGDSPAVFIAVFIFPSSKVPHAQIHLHLKTRDYAFKVLLSARTKTRKLLHFK